jgi:hypothetical protein
MATNYEYDDDEFNDEPTDVVKQLRKVNRTLEKRQKELEEELGNFKNQARQRTVKDVLTSKGINPKVSAFIPEDVATSEDAINEWLNENGELFGVNQTNASESKALPSVDLSAQARINNIVSSGEAPLVQEDSLAKILNAKNADELNSILGITTF